MKLKLSNMLSKTVYALVACLLIWALVTMFANSYYAYNPLYLGVGTLAALALIILFWRLAKKCESFFEKHSRLITAGFLVFMFSLQLAFSFPLRYSPWYDVDALFGGAIEWVKTGSFESYYEYFAMFHNNFGGLVLLRVWFGIAALFGVSDFFIPACLLNCLLSLAAMYLTGSCAGKLFGARGRMTALFLFFISLPFYFIAPAFYTDALTMVFPVLILRLWLCAREQNSLYKRLGIFVLIGLACAIGYGIKATVLIMLIAVVIEGILYADLKAWLPLAAVSAAIVLGFSLALNGLICSHIGKEQAENRRIPLSHWIMMGMKDNGKYNWWDYDFTKSFENPEERAEAIRGVIAERLRENGFFGTLALFNKKIDLVWNDGTYGLSDCLGCPHEQNNFLHEFLIKTEGVPSEVYKHICTAVLAALYLLTLAACVSDSFFKGSCVRILAPRLALFGVFLFFLIWEARWRYFSNFIPIIMLCAITGLECISMKLASLREKRALS